MEHLLDTYVYRYLPFTVHQKTKKHITSVVMDIVMTADWWCKAREFQPFLENHRTLAVAEITYVMLWLFSLCHAVRHGSRYMYTWIGIFLLAIFTESMKYIIGSADVVWHSQTLLTFMGIRTPLYVLCGSYHTLFYTSYVIVRRIRLVWWGEATANGFFVLLLSFPLQVMGTKLLWWQWHDSDPRLLYTIYSVPLVMLALHTMLAASFSVSMYLLRRMFLQERYDWRRFVAEFFCVAGAALMALCITALQYVVFFLILCDIFQIPSVFPTIFLLAIYAVITLKASLMTQKNEIDGRSTNALPTTTLSDMLDELTVVVVIHFLLHMVTVVLINSLDIVSEGVHQPVGSCDEVEPISSLLGHVIYRKKYFCIEEQHQTLFDFHCIPGGQLATMVSDEPLQYYSICGTKFDNRVEYIILIWLYCLAAVAIVFYIMLFSGSVAPFSVKINESKQVCTRSGYYQQKYSNFGFTAHNRSESRRIGSQNSGTLSPTCEKIDDFMLHLRHRSKLSNTGNSSGKVSRLPTPTRLFNRHSKSST